MIFRFVLVIILIKNYFFNHTEHTASYHKPRLALFQKYFHDGDVPTLRKKVTIE